MHKFIQFFFLVLAPFTAGGSMALTYLGIAASGAGSITGMVPDKDLDEAINEARVYHEELSKTTGPNLEKLMLLYTLNLEYLADFEYSEELKLSR